MKRLRLQRWSGSVLVPRARPERIHQSFFLLSRPQTTAASSRGNASEASVASIASQPLTEDILTQLPSPLVSAASSSAKLGALHARLSLPQRVPVETLARTLVDPSADSSRKFNNKPFSVLGADLLGNYTSEYLICQYPRLPLAVVYAAMYAYAGPKALMAMTREWGVETAAEPGGEVDPGLLQFRAPPPQSIPEQTSSNLISTAPEKEGQIRRSISSRTVYNDEFGDVRPPTVPSGEQEDNTATMATLEQASANFVRAVMGAVYLHAGRAAAKQFYRQHFMSRQLDMSKLFQFTHPARDLSRLCAREGFLAPVARLESETGRKSRHPVFVVGVYSGEDKLGEGVGASLDEARTTAAVAALKGWYLYSPIDFRLPSEMEEPNARPWTRLLVDPGDIVV